MTNRGTITGTTGRVAIAGAGTVKNLGRDGKIEGGQYGVVIGGAATVTNEGSISGGKVGVAADSGR